MGITQKEIARDLGISFITVNRAFNGTGYVSEELRQRIFAYAQEHDYVPHKASQVLVRNTTKRISLFSSSLPEYFWNDIDKGVEIAAQQIRPFNYEVTYHRIPEHDTQAYLALLKEDMQKGLDAVALVNQHKYDMPAIFGELEQAGIPFVTFNTDAPQSERLCYIGSDYAAGGRLAADYIGRVLQLSQKQEVLVIQCNEEDVRVADSPDINAMRLEGFQALLSTRYPHITCHVEYINTKLQPGYRDNQILDVLKKYENKVQAIYLIPAFNTDFLSALKSLPRQNVITVLHDLDGSAVFDLETRMLSAVVYQSPVLQGYYTVKALEQILEEKKPGKIPDIEIVHTLVLSENSNLIRSQNEFQFTI